MDPNKAAAILDEFKEENLRKARRLRRGRLAWRKSVPWTLCFFGVMVAFYLLTDQVIELRSEVRDLKSEITQMSRQLDSIHKP